MSKRLKNFRDLGGIKAADGKTVRHGMLYRSGHLCKISANKAEYLRDRKGVRTIVDLRSPSELAEQSDVVANGVRYVHLPPLNDDQNPSINKNNRRAVLKSIMAKEGGARRHLSDIYRLMVTQKESLEAFGDYLRLLAEDGNTGVLWHCTQGKDRTGIAAAIVLMALGAEREAIMRDYMRTNRSCAFINTLIYIGVSLVTFSVYTAHSLNLLLSSRKCFMEAAFDEIDRVYGGTEAFLHEGLGLSDADVRKLRAIYLS
ncbi:MAG: tyrosine-protein phosphatase [Clostridia bacterium]|nr:tyrosine-protein phosphatase [Clostridia bacterium]